MTYFEINELLLEHIYIVYTYSMAFTREFRSLYDSLLVVHFRAEWF